MTGRVTHGWKLSAAVLAIALTVAACGGTDLSSDTAGPTLRDRGTQMRDGGQSMMDTGQTMMGSGQGMMETGQGMMGNR